MFSSGKSVSFYEETKKEERYIMISLEEKIKLLPPEFRQEVESLVNTLYQTTQKESGKMKFDWRGCLKDLRDEFTSVELQHEASKIRIKNVLNRQ